MRQILSAVESLHSHGIIHRDLKLENILLKYNTASNNILSSEIKIIDFNISTRTRNFINNNMPEKRSSIPILFNDDEGDDIYDEKVDIWSLGLLCYEMLFGQKLMSNKESIYTKHIDITIPQTISLKAQTFLISMLQKNGNKRLSATELLKHEFITQNYDNYFYNNRIDLYFTPNNKSKFRNFFDLRQTFTAKNDNHKIHSIFKLENNQTFKKDAQYKPLIPMNYNYKTINNNTTTQSNCTLLSIGQNIDKNELKIIINCCVNSYKQVKGKKYTAIKAAREMKKLLGNNWVVVISNIGCNSFDFCLSCVNKSDLVSFSYENILFQIYRYY
jgi:serine/threonine protein kinase